MKSNEQLANQKQFYVSVSRPKMAAHLVTDDVAKLTDRIEANSGVRATALDSWLKDRDAREIEAQKAAEKLQSEQPNLTTPKIDLDAFADKIRADIRAKSKADTDAHNEKMEQLETEAKEKEKELEKTIEKTIAKTRSFGPTF